MKVVRCLGLLFLIGLGIEACSSSPTDAVNSNPLDRRKYLPIRISVTDDAGRVVGATIHLTILDPAQQPSISVGQCSGMPIAGSPVTLSTSSVAPTTLTLSEVGIDIQACITVDVVPPASTGLQPTSLTFARVPFAAAGFTDTLDVATTLHR